MTTSPPPYHQPPGDQSQSQPLEKRAVVSSFIFNFKDGNPLVALFKRSDKVRTYRGHLAPISGSISSDDRDPLATAWRELSEETGLTSSNLTHWRTGKPFTFSDPSAGREWTVHPFGFLYNANTPKESTANEEEPSFKTDWEHTGWEWHPPSAILNEELSPTVPRLKDSFRRVWFEGDLRSERAGNILATGLERLRNDHESGSQELTTIALMIFRDFLVQTQNGMDARWWANVRMAAWHIIKNGRESMGAATMNALVAVLAELDDILHHDENHNHSPGPNNNHSDEQKWERMLAVLDHHLASRKSRATQVKDAFTHYIRYHFLHHGEPRDKLTILTVSASSTIRDSILDAYASLDIHLLELRVLESRPLFEGASIASSLISNFKSRFADTPHKNLRVKVYTDASAAIAAAGVDLLLLGADRLSATRGVSNKTGSLPAALCTRHVSPDAQIVVLSDLEKINGAPSVIDDDKHEGNSPLEVMTTWRSDGVKGVGVLEEGMKAAAGPGSSKKHDPGNSAATVDVENIYFEWVPLHMVDAFVSEEGVMDEGRIREKSEQLGNKVDKFFLDL
ncbi:translation initiation factor eIF-2B subunit family protein [Aspergillus brunneoviolaceus CBS 621.78]|uniref:Translation initiation factor eIF-2B subunit family protein n=1 Tax=Aspergillus brunneoviolaceus CBS 621.78 TaxID=1450534 RepID=A0ACD1GH93_9EURO|nr:translation initiation factor eIF-2B subunit family protein [Aspergillus brunneoviolaceus CBS 621.78]RAH48654.1 translation initiation factor eIF-2B subunit family protein [Aspergillus brunneoviolaceus CBS 621.78]